MSGRCRTPATLPKTFHEKPGHMLSRGRQNVCEHLWRTPKISRKISGENCVCNSTSVKKIALTILQLWFNYLAAPFLKAIGIPRAARTKNNPVVYALTPASLSRLVMITPVCQYFDALAEHQATWHAQTSRRTPRFKTFSISGRISSQPPAFPVFWQLGGLRLQNCIFLPQTYFVGVQWCDRDWFLNTF